jgi:parallel beta-helix repeat protein
MLDSRGFRVSNTARTLQTAWYSYGWKQPSKKGQGKENDMKMIRLAVIVLASGATSLQLSPAQTFVSGNIAGTWTPSGNPYIVTDNATVPNGQTLTIQPGVVVWIGAGLQISAYGDIQAIGSSTQRITFQPPVGSQHWNEIVIGNNVTNRLKYCDFINATNAIFSSSLASFEIVNCTFSNCTYAGVSVVDYNYNILIKNCIFSQSGCGCIFNYNNYYGNLGYPLISANIFQNISGTALSFPNGYSTPTIINNTFVNCASGVYAQDSVDAKILSCLFKNCTSAITQSGSLSRTVNYNNFYGNGANFTGYPSTYGTPILVNRNGIACDLLYNIFQDPQFVSPTDFHLQSTSPCIDAGEGSAVNYDNSFPPSQGTVINDIGAYGGPNAGGWIMPPSTNSFALSAASWVGVTINPPSTGHYELDYSTDLSSWIQITNMDLSAPFLYTEPATSPFRFYRAVKLY